MSAEEIRDRQEAGPSHAPDKPFREASDKVCFTKTPQLNKVYTGVVQRVNKKYYFVTILGLKGGGGHVNLGGNNSLKNVVKVGDKVKVKVISIKGKRVDLTLEAPYQNRMNQIRSCHSTSVFNVSIGSDIAPLSLGDFPYLIDPGLLRLLRHSVRFGCTSESMTLVAMLSQPDVFHRPLGDDELMLRIHKSRRSFGHKRSDHMMLLNVYNSWRNNSYSSNWCDKNHVNSQIMANCRRIRERLSVSMHSCVPMFVESSCEGKIAPLLESLVHVYYMHTAIRSECGMYYRDIKNRVVHLFPLSALHERNPLPEFVICHQFITYNNTVYMLNVSEAKLEWLRNVSHKSEMLSKMLQNYSKKKAL